MDWDDYVAARRARLLEHAAALGATETAAASTVDEVLARRRRAIERAEDPDPATYAAVEAALRPQRSWRSLRRDRPRPWLLCCALAVLLVALLLALPDAVRVPSTFALDATDGAALLDDAGLDTEVEPVASCEPHGLALGSDPAPGAEVDAGTTVRLRVAARDADDCAGGEARRLRRDAWRFLSFLRGGTPPRLAETVVVVTAGGFPAVLPAAAVRDPARWAFLQDAADAASGPARGLRVSVVVPPEETCGRSLPEGATPREVLRLQLLDTRSSCPTTIDLYRSGPRTEIDAVVVYPPRP